MQKKKPEGQLWQEFVRSWYATDHGGKVKLAEMFHTTYGVAKHWVSDSGSTQEAPARKEKGNLSAEELLATKCTTNLDFICLDIETSNLEADFSVTLTGAIKPFGKETIIFRADQYPTWAKDRSNDKPLIVDIANELRKHAVIVTHYGTRFDVPFLRAKMVKHGLEPLPQMFAIDSWRIARDNFQVSSRRLKNLAEYFDIGDKSGVEGGLWMKAAYDGSKEAMDEIVQHNIKDVEILEKLACISFPYLKFIRRL